MATTIDNDEVGPDEVLVERKIVPARRQHFSPLALAVLVAFAITCGLVFYAGVPESPPPTAGTGGTTNPAP
jgi:hypothetical protein